MMTYSGSTRWYDSYGWICPKCGRIFSLSTTAECNYCSVQIYAGGDSTGKVYYQHDPTEYSGDYPKTYEEDG